MRRSPPAPPAAATVSCLLLIMPSLHTLTHAHTHTRTCNKFKCHCVSDMRQYSGLSRLVHPPLPNCKLFAVYYDSDVRQYKYVVSVCVRVCVSALPFPPHTPRDLARLLR